MTNRFDYDDINLIPRYSVVESRSECDTSVQLGPNRFRLPVVPANMESVINEEIAEKLAVNGYFYIMHRFGTDNVSFIHKMADKGLVSSISIGVNEPSYRDIDVMANEKIQPDYITIDIAHGHCRKMKRMIKYVKDKLPSSFLIAGNVSTIEAATDLDAWGADAIKVGIGPGSACTTYPTTGFGSRNMQASVVHNCSLVTKKPIIADGGIRTPADVTKSVVLGATMCMAGGMLSSFIDSPGRTVEQNGKRYKEFYGSASSRQSNKKARIEGTVKLNPLKSMSILDYMDYLVETMQSSISYGGGKDLSCLHSVRWVTYGC